MDQEILDALEAILTTNTAILASTERMEFMVTAIMAAVCMYYGAWTTVEIFRACRRKDFTP